MNYDHGFHAGNFADVLKHAVLADLVSRLVKGAGALTVVDSHAGAGWYDLSSPEALRGGEYRQGVLRLFGRAGGPTVLVPYLAALKTANPEGALLRYPGSPLIALYHLRARGDRLIAIERNPSVYRSLTTALSGERRARTLQGDGFAELPRQMPRDGSAVLAMVDPPFESQADYSRATQAVCAARAVAPKGVFIIWMPDKGGKEIENAARAVAETDRPGSTTLLMRLHVRSSGGSLAMAATALVIAGAPNGFLADWTRDLPALAHLLRQGEGFGASLTQVGALDTRAAPRSAAPAGGNVRPPARDLPKKPTNRR